MKKYIGQMVMFLMFCLLMGCGSHALPKQGDSAGGDLPKTIKNIVDTAAEKGAMFMCIEEVFYEDDDYVYTFGENPMSHYIIVQYTDGSEQNVKDALDDGNIEISDLDTYGIRYNADSKHGEEQKEFVVNSNAGKHTARVEIIEWQSDGFIALVTDYTRFDAYDIGTKLFVKFTEDSSVHVYTDSGSYGVEGIPDPQKIPIGTKVYVSFFRSEEISETLENNEDVKTVVYAYEMLSEDLF